MSYPCPWPPDRQRPVHPLRRLHAGARPAAPPAALEGQGGGQSEPPVDPDHPPRSPGRMDGGPHPGRAVAAGADPTGLVPSRSGRAECSPRASDAPGPGTTTGTVTVEIEVTGTALGGPDPVVADVAVAGRTARRSRCPVTATVVRRVGSDRAGRHRAVVAAHPWGPGRLPGRGDGVGPRPRTLDHVGFRTVAVDPRTVASRLVGERRAGLLPGGDLASARPDGLTTSTTPRPCPWSPGPLRRDEHVPGAGDHLYQDRPSSSLATSSGSWCGTTACSLFCDPPDDEAFTGDVVEEVTGASAGPCPAIRA